ncbi:hypothetical protein U1Q18_015884, partial [Sarracenia purpurea var. burkii]
ARVFSRIVRLCPLSPPLPTTPSTAAPPLPFLTQTSPTPANPVTLSTTSPPTISRISPVTTYQSVEIVNPTLVPTQLEIGDNVIFPIFVPVSKLPQLMQPIPSSPISIGKVKSLEANLLKKKKKKLGRDEEEVELWRVGKRFLRKETDSDLVADVSGCLDKYKVYEIEELREAIDGFDEKGLIQGSMYKGCINGGFQATKIQEDDVKCL